MLTISRKGLVTVLITLLVLAAGYGDFRPSSFDLTVDPYKYSLLLWETSNFMDKWLHKLSDLMPWTTELSREERHTQIREFFDLGQELRELERQLLDNPSGGEAGQGLRTQIEGIYQRRGEIRATVEESIESEISQVLTQEGLASRIGLIFPPVDTVFAHSPGVLILSPRDRINMQESILMKPGLSGEIRDRIEDQILEDRNLAALVENTGGVAAFPSVVSESGGLRHAGVTAAHEWLHHWFFFQPLGQHFWDNLDMTTLNETAATLGGEAIGNRVFTAITGEQVSRDPKSPVPADPDAFDFPGAFDFNRAMHETRLRTEELLAQGKIEEAEAYMEKRRLFMAENQVFIRKINQAFFAFHGTYAASAASISPIDEQLRELRSQSESLEDFLKTVATFGSYGEFLEHLGAIGE